MDGAAALLEAQPAALGFAIDGDGLAARRGSRTLANAARRLVAVTCTTVADAAATGVHSIGLSFGSDWLL